MNNVHVPLHKAQHGVGVCICMRGRGCLQSLLCSDSEGMHASIYVTDENDVM